MLSYSSHAPSELRLEAQLLLDKQHRHVDLVLEASQDNLASEWCTVRTQGHAAACSAQHLVQRLGLRHARAALNVLLQARGQAQGNGRGYEKEEDQGGKGVEMSYATCRRAIGRVQRRGQGSRQQGQNGTTIMLTLSLWHAATG